ncbi:MAG: dihydroorotate dehydrogenase electron transfer subunit [Lentimicrobiaceae bacterium]|jgi:dihydroorotate dehydrogenase electron transfer subunit
MNKFIHDFVVTRNHHITDDYFAIYLKCPVNLPQILPGQFTEVHISTSTTTYLRRPFSIYDTDYGKNELSLLIKTVGDGTNALSKLKEGDTLNLIYPLGNSFSLPEGDKALLIGGGVGIAPMLLLTKLLHAKGYKPDVLIGGRTSGDIVEPEKYKPFGEVFITTDDGSAGEKGMVTQHSLFSGKIDEYSAIYACGPDPMMKAVARLAASHNIPCEISLENTMACGIGACLCCVVETVDGNKTTCMEGPVFNTRKLKL